MKKYTLVLLGLAFVFSSFNINVAKASNCAPGEFFNTSTGQPCGTIPQGSDCAPGDLFSSVDGRSCGTVPILPPGCTSTSGFSTTTGESCGGPIPPSYNPYISVLSPNGGETWATGTTQTIKWRDNGTTTCQVGMPCIARAYDIKLVSYYPSSCILDVCTTGVYPIAG